MSYAGKIKINSTDFPIASTLYKECTTAADATPKIVSFADFDTLLEGVMIAVKFANTNTAVNPQLQVGSTVAKIMYTDGVNPIGDTPSTSWPANSVVLFIYDGQVWRMINTSKALRAEMLAADTALQSNIDGVSNSLTSNVSRIDTNVADRELKMLRFSNAYASFSYGNGITNFPYRAAVSLSGVTSSMVAYVCFSGNNAGSGNYASYCQTYNGGVYVYSAVSGAITIPYIICWRP